VKFDPTDTSTEV